LQDHTVDSLDKFLALVSVKGAYGTLYRGMRNAEWKLIPSVGRYLPDYEARGLTRDYLLKDESAAMRIFRKQCAAHLGYIPKDGWEVWSIAQHHGLPTRLMDWTYSPLVGLFFAVEDPWDGDSVVYFLRIPEAYISIMEEEGRSQQGIRRSHPLGIKGVRVYEPSYDTPRIHAQSAMFTVQEDPTHPLEEHVPHGYSAPLIESENMWRIRIENSARSQMRVALFNLGITRKLLFPELDGLADWLGYMKWGFPFDGSRAHVTPILPVESTLKQ